MGAAIRFIRKNGRVIPIRTGVKIGAAVAGGAAASVGVAAAISSKSKGKSKEPDSFYKYGSYAAQVASGAVSALPTKGKLGFALAIGSSIALDSVATALNAKSVVNMRGTRWQKAKVFGEQQALGTALGYGVFGAGLLSQRSFRFKAAKTGLKAIRKVKGWIG